ncbi:MAG: tripartite tricarboxylate transporter substrate binding protein [Betaproteobacteria bacterium]|nr:tripartite tricarboxylate transporter substrate binding protein [Betaproteobacteria bacterium]
MTLPMSIVVLIVAGLLPSGILAQAYPTKPIRFIVPFAAGGGVDISARLLAERLNKLSGYEVLVDNRPGANGDLAAVMVARAPADGYTLLMSGVTAQVINSAIQIKPPYDLLRDFAPISLVGQSPLVLVVHPSLQVTNVKEFIALAKARPGQLNYGSAGGGPQHLAGILFDKATGIKTTNVPYRGGAQAMADIVAGHVEFGFSVYGIIQQFVHLGKIRMLGVASLKRYAALPDLPTIDEQGIREFETETVNGVLAPARTPRAIQETLNTSVLKALADPDFTHKLLAQGFAPRPTTLEQFSDYLRNDVLKYSKAVREAGLKGHY